jgi:hypothetical protein
MIHIYIPGNNIPEREYVINTLISDFLGLKYRIIIDYSSKNYIICFDDKRLIIRDSFFTLYSYNLSYLDPGAIPQQVSFAKNKFIVENDIPVLYGSDDLIVENNQITCGIDIFAGAYFLLARWEEYVNKTRDVHNRFPGDESMLHKFSLLHRPVVNEYVEMLWNFLVFLGFKGERKKRSFELVLTHDIDHLDYPRLPRILIGDVLKRKNPVLAGKHLVNYVKTGNNPYDTFDFLMSSSERMGLKSHFYFMSSDTNKLPDLKFYLNTGRFKKKVNEVRDRGHIIGFHPGYYTFNDQERWSLEKQILEKAVQIKISEGRQHYLRFDIPDTFAIWENNQMQVDSTMGYAENDGFRCGTGDYFHVFNFLERRTLKLKERPLIIMDGTLKKHYSLIESLTRIRYYIDITKKYNSCLTLLFHNSTFYGEGWEGYDLLYSESLDYLKR